MSKKIEDIELCIKALEELEQTEYIHYNLPQNELEAYEETIKWVKSINVDSKMFEPSGIKLYRVRDQWISKIDALLDYYREIQKVHKKTSFVIKDYKPVQQLETDLNAVLEFYIEDETKQKLNEAIELLTKKRNEIIDYRVD